MIFLVLVSRAIVHPPARRKYMRTSPVGATPHCCGAAALPQLAPQSLRGLISALGSPLELAYFSPARAERPRPVLKGGLKNAYVADGNDAAEQLFGYVAGEIIGKSITLLIPPHLRYEVSKVLDRLVCGERIEHFETTRVRKDGSLVSISLSISDGAVDLRIPASGIRYELAPNEL